jgi:hypothetical protein
MRVANDAPHYIEVDPSDVTVTGFQRNLATGMLEAWGTVRRFGGAEYSTRVAYQTIGGHWQAEGTTNYESPPAEILRQILDAIDRERPYGFA